MARTALAKTAGPGVDPIAGVIVTMTVADVVNFNSFPFTGREIIIIQNTGAAAYTYTVTSKPDERGRTLDIAAQTLAIGEVDVIGFLSSQGWRQTDGNIYLQASNAAVKFGVIVQP